MQFYILYPAVLPECVVFLLISEHMLAFRVKHFPKLLDAVKSRYDICLRLKILRKS